MQTFCLKIKSSHNCLYRLRGGLCLTCFCIDLYDFPAHWCWHTARLTRVSLFSTGLLLKGFGLQNLHHSWNSICFKEDFPAVRLRVSFKYLILHVNAILQNHIALLDVLARLFWRTGVKRCKKYDTVGRMLTNWLCKDKVLAARQRQLHKRKLGLNGWLTSPWLQKKKN